MANNTAGSRWLHSAINHTSHTRVWKKLELELWEKAEKWLDDGVDEDEVIERVKTLRRVLGGGL